MLRSISIYIQNCSTYFFHVVFTMCLETSYICNLRMRSFRTPYFKVQRHFEVIYICMNTGTNWYEIQRDTLIKTRPWEYIRSLHWKYSGEPHTISHSKSSCEILRTIFQPKKGVWHHIQVRKRFVDGSSTDKLPLVSFSGCSTCWMVYFNIQQHTIQCTSLLEHVDPYVIDARVIGNLHNCLIYLLPFLISVNVLPNSPYYH